MNLMEKIDTLQDRTYSDLDSMILSDVKMDVAKLISALKFYADPSTYAELAIIPDDPDKDQMRDMSTDHRNPFYAGKAMPGDMARRVLRDVSMNPNTGGAINSPIKPIA